MRTDAVTHKRQAKKFCNPCLLEEWQEVKDAEPVKGSMICTELHVTARPAVLQDLKANICMGTSRAEARTQQSLRAYVYSTLPTTCTSDTNCFTLVMTHSLILGP